MTVKGILRARMIEVGAAPSWGVPDDNSNTEPTAAIAATQDTAKNAPLFGVTTDSVLISPTTTQVLAQHQELRRDRLNRLNRETLLIQSLGQSNTVVYPIYKHDTVEVIDFMLNRAGQQPFGF